MENPSPELNPQSSGKRKSKLWIVAGGIFVLLLLAGSYFYWWYFTTNNLIQLVPVDSVLYVQARDPIWPWSKIKISNLPFPNFYQQTDEALPFTDVNLENDLLANCQQAAFVLMLNEEFNLDPVYLFKLRNSGLKDSTLSKLAYHFIFDNNILAVTTSDSALNKIKEVEAGSIFSLATQIETKKLGRDLLHLYLDADNLKSYLNQSQELLNKIFSHLINQDVYLSLDKKGSQWKFRLVSDSFKQSEGERILIEYLPNDFSIFISNINLFGILAAWGEAPQLRSSRLRSRQAGQVDQDFAEFFTQIISSSKTIYDFDFREAVSILLNQPADLIIFNSENETALGFDYVLVLPQISEEQVSSLEELIKIILAQKLPKEVDYLLPDNSKMTELLAESDAWQWQQDDSGINYLPEPALNFEISYLVEDGKLIISSSAELLKNFVSSEDIVLAELTSQCDQGISSSYLILNSSNTSSRYKVYLPSGMTVMRGDNRGCVINF